MYSSESDTTVGPESDEEGQLYQMIFEMGSTKAKKGENVQNPSSSEIAMEHLKIDAEKETQAVGGNITDYFNYGFDEESWHAYFKEQGCETEHTKVRVQKGRTRHEEKASWSYSSSGRPSIPVSSTEKAMEHLKIDAEKETQAVGGDITDYFNYGFDEESWHAYYKEQGCETEHTNVRVQKGRTRHEEKASWSYSSSGSTSIPVSRHSSDPTDVIGGRSGGSGRVEGRRHLSDGAINAQVVYETPSKKDRFPSYHQHSPSNFHSPFAYIPPPPLMYQSGPPAPSHFTTLDSGNSKGSTSLQPCSSGVSSSLPRSTVSSAGVIDTAKARERYTWQEKGDRERYRKQEHYDRDRDRGRDRKRCSFSYRRVVRWRHRDSVERRHSRHSPSRSREEKEGQHRERRHREDSEEREKSSSSSSRSRSRRDSGDDRDGHKQKEAKRKGKDEETKKK